MTDFSTGRSNPWNIYTSNDPNTVPSQIDRESVSWKGFGASVNAISFGFVATAILISLFLIMAIFEHLFRPSSSFTSPRPAVASHSLDAEQPQKLRNLHREVSTTYGSDFSVLMPGQEYPTYIAQPAPLPCPREGICFPPDHDPNFGLSAV